MISINIQELKYSAVGFHILVEGMLGVLRTSLFCGTSPFLHAIFCNTCCTKARVSRRIWLQRHNNQKLQSDIAKQYLRTSRQQALFAQSLRFVFA